MCNTLAVDPEAKKSYSGRIGKVKLECSEKELCEAFGEPSKVDDLGNGQRTLFYDGMEFTFFEDRLQRAFLSRP